ncbi:CheY-like chemotaxis protein [Pseudomonas sp. JAI115]|uniref:response regulator n=1 Tax=Pseudomonas sp. JAI115 TaxID=2723061 RepID=UPI00160D6864|nr:response regulator [Pseudomonas sp. JAI115]MBB6155191.1 CheY-like chemotaxis protein [Pseudomonas sp. JAI115]
MSRVLVVEDDEVLRWLMSDAVTLLGHQVTACTNADEALSKLGAASAFELIITDIQMPGSVDGLGLARTVWSKHPQIAVILVSGHIVPAPGRLPGNVRFVAKPYTLRLLQRAIKELLNTP